MKQTEPNSLERALAKGVAGPHPDANVLAAFAEGELLPHEREDMLKHVALCAECRQVLSAAGDAVELETPSRVERKERPNWRIAGPLLAAAALIALATTVGIRNVLNRPAESIAVAPKNTGASTTVTPASPTAPPQPGNGPEQKRSARRAERAAVAAPSGIAMLEKPAGARAAPVRDKQAEQSRAESASPPVAPTGALSQAQVGPVVGSELHGQAAAPRPSPPNGSITLPRMDAGAQSSESGFSNSTASRTAVGAAGMAVARPRWRINAQGRPERSFGQGPWQPVPPGDGARMQVISVFGGQVWTGGERSQVFRSPDNGTTWRSVNLPEKDGTAHTIAHIRFESAQEITIEAADGTTWSTTDGGASWK